MDKIRNQLSLQGTFGLYGSNAKLDFQQNSNKLIFTGTKTQTGISFFEMETRCKRTLL